MEEPDIKRKLATILVADIVGYSRLTANDEDWTIRALGDFRKIVDDIITRHDGRIFSTGGDSVLAEFASPVEAVRCAVDFQEASRSRNLLQPRDRQLRYRIGINLGDVMVRGEDLLGDGVNVAARLEGIAEPGGICVSGTVWDHINGKLSIGYVDIGEQSVKNIPRPVRAFHLRVDGSVGEATETQPSPPIAVRGPVATAAGAKRVPLAAILGGAAAIIAVLVGLLAWQMWPKNSAPVTATAPTLQPSTAAPALKISLAALLGIAVPGLSEKTRNDLAHDYETAAGHKAQAVSVPSSSTWRTTNRPTAANAETATLEECQVVHGQPCVLLAVDDDLKPPPEGGKWVPRDMSRARYSGDFDIEQIPGLRQENRNRQDIVGYRSAASPKAAAYNADGARMFIATEAASQRASEEAALQACRDNATRDKLTAPCFLYAVEQRVVLPLRLKEPWTPAAAPAPAPPAAPQASASTPAPSPSAPPQAAVSAPAQPAASPAPPKTFRDCPNCPEMVVIPAGSFQMGASPGEHERYEVPTTEASRDQPQHQVTIAKPFALAKFDVTRAEFAAFAAATGFRPRPGCLAFTGNGWTPQPQATWAEPGFAQTDKDPAVCMNEVEIGAYLRWLRQTTGKEYRLPSEAEWEYAERAGSATAFYWGDDPKGACAYENVGDEDYGAKYTVKAPIQCHDGFADMAPVGSFKPSAFGLYDMAGNVTVLTADCWNENYTGGPTDGTPWMAGDCTRHVARKASFGNSHSWVYRSANRGAEGSIVKRNRFGFRVALSLP